MEFLEKFDHCKNFLDVMVASFEDEFIGEPKLDTSIDESLLMEMALLHCERADYIVGLVDGETLIGYIETGTVPLLRNMTLEVLSSGCVFIAEEYRRQGYGEMLMQYFIDQQKTEYFFVNPSNTPSINLLRKLGLKEERVSGRGSEQAYMFHVV